MISQKNRFHGHGSLRFVYQKGRNSRGQYFSIKTIENRKRDQYRLSVVVSKKVSKLAVVRNRIRRRIYETVRTLPNSISAHDIVITVHSDQVQNLPQQQIKQQIIDQFKQTGVIS